MGILGARLGILRAETAEAHERIEDRLTLLDANLTRARYAEYLAALLAVVEPLERALLAVEGIEIAWPDLRSRQKTERLRGDLRELGYDVHAAEPVFSVATLARALGVGYVLEGSTLGGEVIRRQLEQRLGDVPTSYLRCYGSELRSRWIAFLTQLEAAPLADANTELIMGAHYAFDAVEASLDARGLMR